MIEHGGNTNDCGCPMGCCDCDVRIPLFREELEKFVRQKLALASKPGQIGYLTEHAKGRMHAFRAILKWIEETRHYQ